ncbi:MAG: cell division protein FtsQ/DivIB [Acidiferrobacteraceae bacterium]
MTRAAESTWFRTHPQARRRLPAVSSAALLGVVLVSAVFGMVHYVRNPHRFPVRQVMLQGDFSRVNRAALNAAIATAIRGNFFRLNLNTIAQRAQKVPWVDQVAVTRVWPFRLKLQFTVQHPVARWRAGGWINSTGQRVHLGPHARPSALPLLSGPALSEGLMYTRFQSLSRLLARYHLSLNTLSLSARGGWRLSTTDGMAIVMGRSMIRARLTRFLMLRPRIMADTGSFPERVDLRYGNGFAVSWVHQAPDRGKQ